MRVALAAFLSLITTAAALGQETTAERLDALEKRVRALEAAVIGQPRAIANRIPGSRAAAGRATSSAKVEDKAETRLKLTKWSASVKEGQYSISYYVISYTLLNNYDQPVRAISGGIRFFDREGAQISALKFNQDIAIEAGKEASFKSYRPIDPSTDSEMRLKDLAPEDVRAELDLRKIVFRDNTIIDLR